MALFKPPSPCGPNEFQKIFAKAFQVNLFSKGHFTKRTFYRIGFAENAEYRNTDLIQFHITVFYKN